MRPPVGVYLETSSTFPPTPPTLPMSHLFSRVLFASAFVVLAANLLSAAEQAQICRYCEEGEHEMHRRLADDPVFDAQLRKYAPDRLVDVLRIAIDVTPDFARRTIAAQTTVTFAPISEPVQELRLNATRLSFSSVVGSREVAEYVATDHDVTILFAEPIPVGEETRITFTYTAEPTEGLYFRTEAMGYPAGDDHIWTQGETHEAPSWFPCFDYPNERSSTEVTCRVPPAMTVLSNGELVSEQVDPNTGLKAVHWRQEKPHVSYLVCLVAGHLEKLEKTHGDLKLRFFTQPSLAEYAASSFADTDAIMAFYEAEIGVPFPWAKYDQVTIRDFTAGGMENTTLTTLTHRTVFSDETENIYSTRNLDAHETAHQWFGDLVTCEDWSHLWLNEGFATFYTHLYDEHKLGRDEFLYRLYRDATGRVLSREKDTRPIVWREYKFASEQFDFRAYPKGSWVLHMLRSHLGKDLYRQAITNYLNKHKFTSVVTADLVAELEDVSGKSLDRFFDQWVYHGGFPKLKVTHKWLPSEKLAHVRIEQTQEVSDEVMLFHLPTKLRFYVGDEVVDHEIMIDGTEHDFYVALDKKPEVVRLDPELSILAKTDFNKPQAMLERQLSLQDDVIGRVLAAKALGKNDKKQVTAALRTALNSDAFYGVRVAAAQALGKQFTDEALEALVGSLNQDDARVRAEVVRAISRFYKPQALQTLLTVASEEKNPAIAADAIRGLGKYSEPEALRQVNSALDSSSLKNEITGAAISAIGDLHHERLSRRLLEVLKLRRNELDGRSYARGLRVAASLWRDVEDRTPAYELILAGLNDPSVNVQRGAISALGSLGDLRAEAHLQDAVDAGHPRLAKAAEDALEALTKDAQTTPSEIVELRKIVRELKKEQAKLQKSIETLEATEEH